jgi:hypothetical protein
MPESPPYRNVQDCHVGGLEKYSGSGATNMGLAPLRQRKEAFFEPVSDLRNDPIKKLFLPCYFSLRHVTYL